MPTLNEVFQAAKRGDTVTHRNFGEAKIFGGVLSWVRDGSPPVVICETEADDTAWTITPPKNPHPHGTLDWAKWHVERGCPVFHNLGAVRTLSDFGFGWELSK